MEAICVAEIRVTCCQYLFSLSPFMFPFLLFVTAGHCQARNAGGWCFLAPRGLAAVNRV